MSLGAAGAIDAGQRPVAALIHGLSEERRVWDRQIAGLADALRLVRYDVRGFGTSPTGRADASVAQMADDLAQILSAAQAPPAWLVGFSMGGVIAQRFALDFPERVRGLVLIASSCTVGRAGQAFFAERIGQVEAGGAGALAERNAADAGGCFASGDAALVEEYRRLRVAAVREIDGYLNAARAMLGLATEPLAEQIEAIDRPTLVLAGEHDRYCPPRAARQIAERIPAARLVVVPGVGHCLHWEASEQVNALIGEFIAEHGGAR